MALYEDDMFDDFAYDEAEGASDAFGDEFDEDDFDEFDDEFDEFDEFDEYDELDAMSAYDEFDDDDDAFDDDGDEFDDEFDDDEFDEDSMDEMLAYALAAEDEDEFFGRLFKAAKKIAGKVKRGVRKAAPVIGKIARVAGPILSKIPHPYAQMGAKAAKLLGRLRMEGASEEEALEAFAELAARDPRALPIVATIGARAVLKSKGKRMSKSARVKAIKDVKSAAKTLVRAKGPKAIRAISPIVKATTRQAVRKGTPTSIRPKLVKASAQKVARSTSLTRKLAKPKRKAMAQVKKASVARPSRGSGRSYVIPGPARITITAA
ncbi:hypothetical protein [uncultured Jannaschia sp.]|uniref:hypothetical protein n=1 Tax=uncultured Jannaschia sp. TaxID=293347 RepID=UPI002622E173|nr:hypothetical protein [uncultured Jannaschia sp.]